MSDTSLRFNFLTGRDTASPHMRRVTATALAMGAAQRAASLLALGGYLLLGASIAGLIGTTVALAAQLGPLLGYLAAIPAIAFAGAAGLGALVVGFLGIGAALRSSTGGGANAAQGLASAEHRVEIALRASTEAQEALNDARAEAARRLADVSRELARAQLDERSATLGVAEAQRRLRQARSSPDRLEREGAAIGLQQSIAALEDVRLRIADLKAEEADRSAKGVEGSDEVQRALQRQADAAYELAAAQRAIAQSQGGGVDKAAEAYARLAPSAKALVDVLKALKPEWVSLRAVVQEPLFAGVASDVQALSGAWLPMLRTQLAGVANGWNIAFRSTLQLFSTPEWIADTNAALSNTVTFSEALGRSWAPFASGFRHFTVVGAEFLPRLGAWVERIGIRFNDWAAGARESGRMAMWIERAITVGGQWWQILKNIGGAIRAIFSAGSGGPAFLPAIIAATAELRAWTESDVGQTKMANFFTTLRDLGAAVWNVMGQLLPRLLDLGSALGGLDDVLTVTGAAFGFLADHIGWITDHLPLIISLIVAWKVVQLGYHAAAVISLPIEAARIVAMWRHTTALKANTIALGAQTTVMRTSTAAQTTMNVATAATGPAMQGAAVGTRALGFAMKALPIIGWIALIIELVMWVVDLWNTNEQFRMAVMVIWGAIVSFFVDTVWHNGIEKFLHWVGDGFSWLGTQLRTAVDSATNTFNILVAAATSVRTRIVQTLTGIWDGIVNGLKSALNTAIWLVNKIVGSINNNLVGSLNRIPGVSIPFLMQIPFLDTGGDILRTGLAVVHEGEHVSTAAEVRRGEAGGGGLRLELAGPREVQEMLKLLIRRIVRTDGGGDVQVTFGTG